MWRPFSIKVPQCHLGRKHLGSCGILSDTPGYRENRIIWIQYCKRQKRQKSNFPHYLNRWFLSYGLGFTIYIYMPYIIEKNIYKFGLSSMMPSQDFCSKIPGCYICCLGVVISRWFSQLATLECLLDSITADLLTGFNLPCCHFLRKSCGKANSKL